MSNGERFKNGLTIVALIAAVIAYLITGDKDTALTIGGCVILLGFILLLLAAYGGGGSE